MNNPKEKPIRKLTLADCYELAKDGYIFTKHKDTIIVGKGK